LPRSEGPRVIQVVVPAITTTAIPTHRRLEQADIAVASPQR
jgi:hypothetical protein